MHDGGHRKKNRMQMRSGQMQDFMGAQSHSYKSKGLTGEMVDGLKDVEAVATRVTEECNCGLLVESMKEHMFKI